MTPYEAPQAQTDSDDESDVEPWTQPDAVEEKEKKSESLPLNETSRPPAQETTAAKKPEPVKQTKAPFKPAEVPVIPEPVNPVLNHQVPVSHPEPHIPSS